jgi:hypothetical protein
VNDLTINDVSKYVFLYLRVATYEDGNLERQEKECQEYCEKHGLIVAGVFREICGGLHWQNMEAFVQMRKRYLDSEASGVVVLNAGRISRNLEHLLMLTQEMTEHHITLYCIEDGHSTPPLLAIRVGLDRQGTEASRVSGQEARITSKLAASMPQAEIVISLFEL